MHDLAIMIHNFGTKIHELKVVLRTKRNASNDEIAICDIEKLKLVFEEKFSYTYAFYVSKIYV